MGLQGYVPGVAQDDQAGQATRGAVEQTTATVSADAIVDPQATTPNRDAEAISGGDHYAVVGRCLLGPGLWGTVTLGVHADLPPCATPPGCICSRGGTLCLRRVYLNANVDPDISTLDPGQQAQP